jgi:hypothetical protein
MRKYATEREFAGVSRGGRGRLSEDKPQAGAQTHNPYRVLMQTA